MRSGEADTPSVSLSDRDLCKHVYRHRCHLASEDAFSEADLPSVSLSGRQGSVQACVQTLLSSVL